MNTNFFRKLFSDRDSTPGRSTNSRASKRFVFIIRLALGVAAGAGVAVACSWDGISRSVRFNLGMTEREFSRLPPLPFSARGAQGKTSAAHARTPALDAAGESPEQRTAETDGAWTRAQEAAARGDLTKARKYLRDYLERTNSTSEDEWPAPTNYQERRNSALDQLDALAALDEGASSNAVRSYLDARRVYDSCLSGANERAKDEGDMEGDADATRPESRPVESQTVESRFVESRGDESEQASGGDGATASETKCAPEELSNALGAIERDRRLEDNAAYLRAASLYRAGQTEEAARDFQALAAKYPRSEKREAALFMSVLSELKRSSSYDEGSASAISLEPCPDCRDEAWTTAHETFSRLAREYPRGHYAREARGWLGYLSLRVGDVPGALVEYYRLLDDESDVRSRRRALISLRLARGRADEADMERVESILAGEPRVALTYAYHNLYNYTFSSYLPAEIAYESPFEDEDSEGYRQWKEKEETKIRKSKQQGELARIVAFTTRLMRRYPQGSYGGAFALRVAQANLELGEDRAARELAARALALTEDGNERASALWVKGVAEWRTHDLRAARRTLGVLVDGYPSGDLNEGARRLLAMVAEDAGDLDAALEQYLALDYQTDVAYFVDVLMTPDELAAFVERHVETTWREQLLYALGVRYMRAGRWADARAALARVRTTEELPDASADSYFTGEEEESQTAPPDPKGSFPAWEFYEDAPPPKTVYASWVLRDLQTIDDLERLERAAAEAIGDEAKAEALYQLASYLYDGSELAFYNPAAWQGLREAAITHLDASDFRQANEAQVLWNYMREHETLARALVIYLDVARRFPQTRAARDSLYTAAVCQQHLSNFNAYWRAAYGMGLHAGERTLTYNDVRRTYPDYRLPRGTNGWQPSTRTVNGQPGWDAPPKQPTPTRAELLRRRIKRAERRLSKAWQLFGEVGDGSVRRWSLVLLAASCVLLVLRLTRRARRFLFAQLARSMQRRETRSLALSQPASSYAAHLPYTLQAKAHAASHHAAGALWRLMLDRRVRSALALNLFTHALLTALLWMLVRALRAG